MHKVQLLYVIDDPRIDKQVRQAASDLQKIYPIAFDILYLHHNLGYAGANNQGVKHADSNTLLLLNSDVMPIDKGWLKQLLELSANDLETSIIGARLLYEDNTIQHDGMRFFSSPFRNNLWTNVHPGKGLPADLFSTNSVLVDREAVTGACMLLSRQNFLDIGGFDESYILGDYEDSDLCLRARRQGLTIKHAEQVKLYHLERQSQSLVSTDSWKEELTYYNCWYHTQKWSSDISALKSKVA
jgi:GT2 family glycosyltransferase